MSEGRWVFSLPHCSRKIRHEHGGHHKVQAGGIKGKQRPREAGQAARPVG